jgi:hypothetical protein
MGRTVVLPDNGRKPFSKIIFVVPSDNGDNMPKTDLQRHIEKLVKQYGSWRAAAKACGVDLGYLWKMHRGEKRNPTDKTLEKLGLRRVEKLQVL